MLLKIVETITGVFFIVYEGQHGVRFTLGKVDRVFGPGVHFKLPIFQTIEVEETKDTTLELEPQIIQLKDDLVYEVTIRVLYQIVDLKKALIEVDDLREGLTNRVTMVVQSVLRVQNRESIRDMENILNHITEELKPIGDDWGVVFHKVGFSNFAPSTETLEITQLELLADKKIELFNRFRSDGLGEQAAVSLISGAVMAVSGNDSNNSEPEPNNTPSIKIQVEGDEDDSGE